MSGEPMCRRRRVEFADTDASGRAHFAALLRHVEAVEHEWLAENGIPLQPAGGGWPRVRVECDYRAPVSAREEVQVALEVAEVGASSVEWRFRIRSVDDQVVAEGRMVTVLVDSEGLAVGIPADWRESLSGSV